MNFASDRAKVVLTLFTLAGIFVFSSLFFELAPAEYKTKAMKTREPRKMLAALQRISIAVPPEVSAEGVFVERIRTQEVLFAKDENRIFAPASIAKLMTALLYYEALPALESVSMPQEAKIVLEDDEKRSHLEAGETIKAEDLLKLMIAESDNDAAYAAANEAVLKADPALREASFETRISRFVFLMNQRKDALGLKNTQFTNPSGKDAPKNYSTARELARIAGEIFVKAPKIWDASRLIEGEIYSSSGKSYRFENTNILLKEFPAIYGSKTGFTDEAGGALLFLYELAPEDPIVAVILKSKKRFDDGRAILRWLDGSFKVLSKQ